MSRQGNKYEPTVAFVLQVFGRVEGKADPEHLAEIFLQEDFELPVSKKTYKATAKNIDTFVAEYLSINPNVTSIRLDRISHIKTYSNILPGKS